MLNVFALYDEELRRSSVDRARRSPSGDVSWFEHHIIIVGEIAAAWLPIHYRIKLRGVVFFAGNPPFSMPIG